MRNVEFSSIENKNGSIYSNIHELYCSNKNNYIYLENKRSKTDNKNLQSKINY